MAINYENFTRVSFIDFTKQLMDLWNW